jgi:hypothetical protein
VTLDGPTADAGYWAVGGTGASDLLVGGTVGTASRTLWRYDGETWIGPITTGEGVANLDSDAGWTAVGGGRGVVLVRGPDGPLSSVGDTGGHNLLGVAAHVNEALVVASGGVLGYYDGERFANEHVAVTRGDLRAVARDPVAPGHAVAVGMQGIIERVGVGLWRRRVVADGSEVRLPSLRGVVMGAGLHAAVGDDGMIAESTDGNLWVRVASGTTAGLNAVAGADARMIAVGAGGRCSSARRRAHGHRLRPSTRPRSSLRSRYVPTGRW